MSWKPIDLAPRDGTLLVIAFRSPMTSRVSVCDAKWEEGGWRRQSGEAEAELCREVPFAWTEVPRDFG